MTTNNNKQLVKEYLDRRAADPKPIPSQEEIRRQLGWSSKPVVNTRKWSLS